MNSLLLYLPKIFLHQTFKQQLRFIQRFLYDNF